VKYRNWIDVRTRLPKEKGDYSVWLACGIGGAMGKAYFDGDKFICAIEIYEWMDGYKDA
jgi:hypothetical protein